jgi:UDP-glucose 4-epimerase
MDRRKVVLTGAAGYVSSRMLAGLRERYDLVLLDVQETDRDGAVVPNIVRVDLLDANRNQYRAHFNGADAVIHCGFVKSGEDATPTERFEAELANIRMAYNVYQVAHEEQVRRVVVLSSNHAADYYERLIWCRRWDIVTPDMRPLSDNYYGWAKESYEHLGFVFACGQETGRALENVQLRIGAPRESDPANVPLGNLQRLHRALGAYLSARDQLQLVVKSIETENIRDEHDVPFQIFYGISDNSHRFWSIVNAYQVIGYAPEDNSSVVFADEIRQHIAASEAARR